MVYDAKTVGNTIKDYTKSRKWLDDVEVEIVGGENDIDPLTLLRVYEKEVSVDNELILADGFCMNRVIRFSRKKEVIFEMMHKEHGDFVETFKEQPFLLDLLCKTCYGIMLKKLTPPSEGSENEDER